MPGARSTQPACSTSRSGCCAAVRPPDARSLRRCPAPAPRSSGGACWRLRTARAAASQPGPSDDSDPGPKPAEVVYTDGWSDLAFIALCRLAYGRIAGFQSARRWDTGPETFAGMVEVSRALMKGRSAAEQRAAVIQGFPRVPPWFRRAFPYSRWGAELNARITPAFFAWLVGPMQPAEAEVGGATQRSAVKIERCRYLAESGCVGMCVNLCKGPTQQFFTRELGMPLTMTPNFEDLSCEMVFGQEPPPLEEDPALQQPCLAACPSAAAGQPACQKLR